MMIGKVELLRDEVIGLRPVYCDMGNCTELLLKNGKVVLDRRVMHSVLKALAASYAVDLKAQRRILQMEINRKGMLPFYLGDGRVFIPLKMRHALTEKDAVYGYVDLAFITEPQKGVGRECRIALSNGLQLQVLSTTATVQGAWHSGLAALDLFKPTGDEDAVEALLQKTFKLILDAISRRVQQMDRIEYKVERHNEAVGGE
ncbi:MAG: hypothetical protein ACM3NJ_00600 [Methanobacterium sp.]